MALQASQSFPAEEYFELLLERAERAARDGNYGIAAALVVRGSGRDLLVFGVNSLFTEHNPCGHAEVNAILATRSLGLSDAADRASSLARLIEQGEALLRPAPSGSTGSMLYTTLEPCPMCAVCILNAGIDRVVIAAEDPPSGVLAPDRLAALPSLWRELGSRLEISWAQSERPQERSTYVPSTLRSRLIDVFANSRQVFDSWLGTAGVLDLEAVRCAISDYPADDHSGTPIVARRLK